MSSLIATCMIEKSKRTCKVEHCSLARCCGCFHADISRERYKSDKGIPINCIKCSDRDLGVWNSMSFCEKARKHIKDDSILPKWCPKTKGGNRYESKRNKKT